MKNCFINVLLICTLLITTSCSKPRGFEAGDFDLKTPITETGFTDFEALNEICLNKIQGHYPRSFLTGVYIRGESDSFPIRFENKIDLNYYSRESKLFGLFVDRTWITCSLYPDKEKVILSQLKGGEYDSPWNETISNNEVIKATLQAALEEVRVVCDKKYYCRYSLSKYYNNWQLTVFSGMSNRNGSYKCFNVSEDTLKIYLVENCEY